jgi:hypothetical protein
MVSGTVKNCSFSSMDNNHNIEELDGRAVSTLVRLRKLSNVRRGQSSDGDQNVLSRAPPCFGRHVKPLVPVAFAVVSTHSSFKEG